ncbi:MAG: bifunctional adenosylcobinamide kinase/adenosylcobinamide-phosphate guanylyltransferase [Anaerolineae bacterium]|nr:bifunctional adenosylcobinamide kinase/adenosylcobinamide-phosphate guanylyltransferase [Anaerolineae bacterium]
MNGLILPQLTLILGGARSGKSTYAQNLAVQNAQRVLYVATAEAGDEEMLDRINKHRASRPSNWKTLETSHDVGQAVLSGSEEYHPEIILLDCLTLLVSNVIVTLPEEAPFFAYQKAVEGEIEALISSIHSLKIPWLIVSNEVGMGLVPPYALGRYYRDVLGWANQRLAAEADRVVFMVSGLTMNIKG